MSVTINTGVTKRGLNGAFFARLAIATALWREICTLIQSDGKSEEYKWLGQNPMPREWKGKRQAKPLLAQGQTIVNKHWEATLLIDRDEFADDQTGQLRLRAEDFANRFAQHPDKILLELINNGEAALGYDGQFFYDTDHVEGDSGSQSNDLTYDVATPASPTEAEFEKAFWQAVEAMVGFVDDQGEPMNMFNNFEQLDGMLVLVPKNMMRVASKVLGVNAAPILNNETNILAGRAKVVISPRFSASDKFDLFKVDEPTRPFIFQQRQPVETEIKDDKDEKDVKYMADSRYEVGYGLWPKAVRTTLV